MHWFYDPELSDAVQGQQRILVGSEAHHAAAVLRIRIGEQVVLTDGLGTTVACNTLAVAKNELTLQVASVRQHERPVPEVWLFQALAKGDRDELAIQMATELGVGGVAAWQAARSVSRWDTAKTSKGIERWRQICIEASKQSHRSWFPNISDKLSYGIPHDLPGLTLVLEPSATNRLSQAPISGSGRVNIIVGPEGGLTEEELADAESCGYLAVALGDEVLRTSTAGPAALAMLHGMTGRW